MINRPSDKSVKGSDVYLAVMKAYRAQHKIGNPYSFMRSLVTDDLTGGVVAGGGSGGSQKPGGELDG